MVYQNKNNLLTMEAVLEKLKKYCAYQERCRQDVITRLYELKADKGLHLKIIELLEEENFINEKRFAESYARGKLNIKKWGKSKIANELKAKGIPAEVIEGAIGSSIQEEDYLRNLEGLFDKKKEALKGEGAFVQKQKIFAFLYSKGFEPELIYKLLDEKGYSE